MTANHPPHRPARPQLNDDRTALRVAALPQEHSRTKLIQLFERGYEYWTADGEAHTTELLTDIGRFGTRAFKQQVRTETLEQPIISDPGALAVLATLSALCVKTHPKFERVPPTKLQLVHDIGECYVNTILGLCWDHTTRITGENGSPDRTSPYQDLAETLYAKPEGEDGPHPGRVCTEITQCPAFEAEYYAEIPMAAASRACHVRTSDEDIATTRTSAGSLRTEFADNHLYVPVAALERTYREAASATFGAVLRAQEHAVSADQLRWLVNQEDMIEARINRFLRSNHHHRLWTDWNNGERLLRALRSAIRAAPDEAVRLGEFYPVSRLYAAVEQHDPCQKLARSILGRITSPARLAKLLASLQDHPEVTVRTEERGDRFVALYRLTSPSSSSRPLAIEAIEDLFELPCMANMDEQLTENGPVRKDLYNFVRTILWLPQYQDAAFETILDDLKAVFERWPWYDEQITEYQVRYEFDNTIDEETPLPMNCDNEDIQRYCIGQDVCPYSIWGSLPFPDEMYQQVDGNDDFGSPAANSEN